MVRLIQFGAREKPYRSFSTPSLDRVLDRIKVADTSNENYPEPIASYSKTHYKKEFGRNNAFVTFTNLMKSLVTPTILVMPGLFAKGGLVFSVIGFLSVVALISTIMKGLVDSASHLSDREHLPVRTYGEVAYVSFLSCSEATKPYASAIKLIVNLLFFITYIDTCTIYMIYLGSGIDNLVRHFYPNTFFNVRHFVYCQVLFLIFMSTIRNLKYIAPFSFCSCIALIVGVCVLAGAFFFDSITEFKKLNFVGDFSGCIRFFCVVFYALSGLTVSLTMKSSMKHPEQFFGKSGIYLVAVVFMALLYVPFGFLGYIRYGDNINQSVMLTIPKETNLALFVRTLCMVAILLSAPLNFYFAFNVVWNNYLKFLVSEQNVIFVEYTTRFGFIVISFLFAFIFPHLNVMILLKGALFHTFLEITIPAILIFVTYYPELGYGKYYKRIIITIALVVMGIFCCIAGIITAVKDFRSEKFDLFS